MKKIFQILEGNTEIIIGIILGLFLTCSATYAATIFYGSDEVSYSNSTLGSSVTTAKGALDSLYSFVTNPGTLTLGATNGTAVSVTAGLYNKVNTTAVYNAGVAAGATTHTATFNFPSGSKGSTSDGNMGVTHSYRYVNASNVYNKGKADGVTSHSGTYTYPANSTGGTVDLGTSHTYRYVDATNVYNKGKADGVTKHTATKTLTSSQTGTVDLGTSHTYRYVDASSVFTAGFNSRSMSLYNAQWISAGANTVSLGKHWYAVIVCNQCKVTTVSGASYSREWSRSSTTEMSYTYRVNNFTTNASALITTSGSYTYGWVWVLAVD